MTGASLRLFLVPGTHFHDLIMKMLQQKRRKAVSVRAVSCNPEFNRELPIRSFVEEFDQHGSLAKKRPFNFKKTIDFQFSEFEDKFFADYGINADINADKTRATQDLISVQSGVDELNRIAANKNSISYRKMTSAPYCTAIIFPEKAYYTPNMLCVDVPVNLPMMVFHRSSDAYRKLVGYFEFIWWVNEPWRRPS